MDLLRVAFVVFHVVAITLLAIPAPVGALNKRNLEDPKVQDLFQTYAGVAGDVGWHISGPDLQALAWDVGERFMDVRSVVLRPFRPYYKYAGTRQGWRMFGTVSDRPARLLIEVDEGEGWRPLYEARSDQYTWRRRQFDEERFRAFINAWSHLDNKADYTQFARWVADRVAEDLPAARKVRLTMLQRRTPSHDVLWKDGFPEDKRRWETTVAVK